MYSTHNEGNYVDAESFIRNLKNKICKYKTLTSKNVYIDKLDETVNKYNNTYHSTIKVKPVDVKDNAYIDFGKKSNNKDPKFQVGDHVKISKPKNILVTEILQIGLKKLLWTYVINDLNGEEIFGTFYEKELQKAS